MCPGWRGTHVFKHEVQVSELLMLCKVQFDPHTWGTYFACWTNPPHAFLRELFATCPPPAPIQWGSRGVQSGGSQTCFWSASSRLLQLVSRRKRALVWLALRPLRGVQLVCWRKSEFFFLVGQSPVLSAPERTTLLHPRDPS